MQILDYIILHQTWTTHPLPRRISRTFYGNLHFFMNLSNVVPRPHCRIVKFLFSLIYRRHTFKQLKNANFSVKTTNISMLALKMLFQIFSFATKKVQGFPSHRTMSLQPWLFHLQNHVTVFWNFKFWSRYLGKRSLCPRNQPHFLRNSDKSLLYPQQKKLKEIWDTELYITEDNNAKINVSPNIPWAFLLFKVT